MMQVKTSLAESAIHGLGLFAAEPIEAGTVVWKLDLRLDRIFPPEEVAAMPAEMIAFLRTYGCKEHDGSWRMDGDHGRFANHSDNPNCATDPDGRVAFALANIGIGDELTWDYRQICRLERIHLNTTLKETQQTIHNGKING